VPTDSGNVDAALSQKLLSDVPLMAMATDGVYFDVAKKGATRFILVSLLNEDDTPMFNGRAFEDGLYLVKAVIQETSGANVRSAAARIDALLDRGTLLVDGYGQVTITRTGRVRYTEVDEDNDARWQHRGGHYRVMAAPGN
jgi:hypothetical protein